VTRRLVDADALTELCAAAAQPHPDPSRLRVALAALAAAESVTPSRPWCSVDEAARTLGVSERTIRRQVARGRLEHRREGRRLLIAATSLAPRGPERTRADTRHDNGGAARHGRPTSEETP
jgi:excisionase family DNA binding protein